MLWLRKLAYRGVRLVSALRYWVRRRFTRAGLMALGGGLLAGSMGVDPDQTVAYQAFMLLAGLLSVAVVTSRFFRVRCRVERTLPRFGTVGLPLAYRLSVRNETTKTQRGLVLLDDLADPRPSFEEYLARQLALERRTGSFRLDRSRRRRDERADVKEAPLPSMAPHQTAVLTGELLPRKRGALTFTGVTLARPDPLGLCRALVRQPLPQSVLILPRRYPLPAIALPGAEQYQAGGVALASSVGQTDEFVALREYRRGDPLRRIHWRSWAKAGQPIVKEFEDEHFVRHALILDTFTDDPDSEPFEEAVSVAASFACTVQTQESLLDLLFVGNQAYCFTAGRGLGHVEQMLEVLAAVQPCHAQPFGTLESTVLEHASAVSGCVCVWLAWDEPRRRLVERLTLLGVPVLTLVIVQPGATTALDAGPLRDKPGLFHVLEAGSIAEGLARL